MKYTTRKTAQRCLTALAATLLPAIVGHAADPLLSYKSEIIAKAQADECFYDLYDPDTPGTGENEYVKAGIDCDDCINDGGEPKINQSYVWGLTRKDNYLWWGTGPNINRLVSGAYFGSSNSSISHSNSRNITFSATEYGNSKFSREGAKDGAVVMQPVVDASLGDWRPPDIFCYNLDTNTLERKDLDIKAADASAWSLLWRTIGLRSAGFTVPTGTHTEGIIFLAGPNMDASTGKASGVSMFAFDAATRTFIAAQDFPLYTNIRKWKSHNGQLYTAIATDTGSGEVLRWVNNPASSAYPFQFQVVGILDAGGAELEIHNDGDGDRLYVNTWPGIEGNLDLSGDITTVLNLINAPAGLWRSPIIPAGGLTSSNANNWDLVWSVVDYEPDLVVGLHYGGGAMASFDGHLYWGTMHVPGTSNVGHTIGYGPPDPIIPRPDPYPTDPEDPARVAYEADVERFQDEQFADFVYSYRSISIWRGKDFTNTGGDIELVYGKEKMPVRLKRDQFMTGDDPRADFNIQWTHFFTENIGQLRNVPDGESHPYYSSTALAAFGILLGIPPAGSRALPDGGDWNGGFANFPDILAQQPNVGGYVPLWGPEGITEDQTFFSFNNYTWTMQVFDGKLYIGTMNWDNLNDPDVEDGAHLYCIPSSTEPAVRVTGRGMANWSSYGIRTIAADDSRGELYLGMANVQNMMSTKVGDPVDGGWEIQRVTMRYADEDLDELDDAWEISEFGDTTTVNDAEGNSDIDKFNDYDEWLAGTDPNDTNSFFFAAVEDSTTPGMQQIEWASIANRYYTVCEITDLENGTWLPVATYAGTGSGLMHEYDPSSSNAKFFKVVVSLDAPAP